MHHTFLELVAQSLLDKFGTDLSRVAVVFPNKRTSLFLNKALAERVQSPFWSPAYITISDLFRQHSTLKVPDQAELVFTLYDVYTEVMSSGESLDHFYSWGQMMLSDFDDLDKNMVDALPLFQNIEALQSLVSFDFLTQAQRESLEAYLGSDIEESVLRKRFTELWSKFPTIYTRFRSVLLEQGLAYEGMLYRDVVNHLSSIDFHFDHYVFVGFNLLQKVEQALFSHLRTEGRGLFYWDYDDQYVEQEAGAFVHSYLQAFPNELATGLTSRHISHEDIYGQMRQKKDIRFLSAKTSSIQASYVSRWILEGERLKAGARTAIVLADEAMLQQVVRALPPEVDKVNITTGFPLHSSSVWTLVMDLLQLQIMGRPGGGDKYRLKSVLRILRHPLVSYISPHCAELESKLQSPPQHFPLQSQLCWENDEGLQLLFGLSISESHFPLLDWMCQLLRRVAHGLPEQSDPLIQECLFRMHGLLFRLSQMVTVNYFHQSAVGRKEVHEGRELRSVSIGVLRRLLQQMVQSTSVPFHGEPAEGIQIMGVLETRNLDFDHVLLLSCNEGNLPKGVNDASLIPHSLRHEYQMTTVENKVSIYSYYFHSLLQRASDITITYNNATDEGQKGEMSRFMTQLLVSRFDIQRFGLLPSQEVEMVERKPVHKGEKVMEVLNQIDRLEPTYLSRYLRCPLQFYFSRVEGLREPDTDDEEEMDGRAFGKIFHDAAQHLYLDLSHQCSPTHFITAEDINHLLEHPNLLFDYVDRAFAWQVFHTHSSHFQPPYNGMQRLMRNIIQKYLIRLLTEDLTLTPFAILSLEDKFYANMSLVVDGAKRNIRLGGVIDRVDCRKGEDGQWEVRIVDYKTGVAPKSCPTGVADVFDPSLVVSKETGYYLQTFIYAKAWLDNWRKAHQMGEVEPRVSPALLFVRTSVDEKSDAVLSFKPAPRQSERISDVTVYEKAFDSHLTELLENILSEKVDFAVTSDLERCDNCPYAQICR